MASKEVINAKFEALEARMEDKIRMLFTELILGRPLSPKKSHQGESFAQVHPLGRTARGRTDIRGVNHTNPKDMTSKRGEAL